MENCKNDKGNFKWVLLVFMGLLFCFQVTVYGQNITYNFPGQTLPERIGTLHCCPEKFYHSLSCVGPSPSGTLAVRSV